ncbi:hypothetical protein [Vulgatibacter sp.]|uniref:hypothetical protein n=1 Tax=Vulgatibacter sp. TaxID=1971226 RepID=UPI003568E6C1
MANPEKQRGAETPAARMRLRYAAGDFQGARAEAWTVLHDETAPASDRAAAQRLREQTEVDKRAWAIALFALAIAATVVIFFLL